MNVIPILDRLFRTVASFGRFDRRVLYDGLFRVGVESDVAQKTVLLVPIAFGRILMSGLSLPFTDHFFHFSREGHLLLNVALSREPIYTKALRVNHKVPDRRCFEILALASPELASVSHALEHSLHCTDMVSLPLVTFADPPSSEGLIAVQRVLADFMPEESFRSEGDGS